MIKKFFLVFLCIFNVQIFFSHPHLFVEPSLEVLKGVGNNMEIKIHWKWDQWWSMDIITECDRNNEGFLDEEEVELVYENYFKALRHYDFFTEIFVNSKQQKFNGVERFHAVINEDNTVTYSFVVPLQVEPEKNAEFKIKFMDPTIFVAFDREIGLIKNDTINYKNTATSSYGYYGVQVEFRLLVNPP